MPVPHMVHRMRSAPSAKGTVCGGHASCVAVGGTAAEEVIDDEWDARDDEQEGPARV